MTLVLPGMPPGAYVNHAGLVAPSGWLLCDGTAYSRTTYSALFNAIVPLLGTFTVTIATPGVVTMTAHGMQTGAQVFLTTTGALPTGLTANTLYYVIKIDANSFNLATSRANAYAATKIATSGTQSGTHSLNHCGWGLGDGSTTFNVPDLRGRTVFGADGMGGTAASRLTLGQLGGVYGNQGATGGEQGHQLTTAELASHIHTVNVSGVGGITIPVANGGAVGATNNTSSAGGDAAHNTVPPAAVDNYIIKY